MAQPEMLIDSNIVIYSIQPQHQFLRNWMTKHVPVVSEISRLEVLGFHQITSTAKSEFTLLFQLIPVMPLATATVDRAISLRQVKRMSVGDALIAATALEHQFKLITRNKSDFNWISGLQVFDPFDSADFAQIV